MGTVLSVAFFMPGLRQAGKVLFVAFYVNSNHAAKMRQLRTVPAVAPADNGGINFNKMLIIIKCKECRIML